MRELLELINALGGAEASRGELLVWLAVVGGGFGSGAWVGFELTRLVFKGLKQLGRLLMNR